MTENEKHDFYNALLNNAVTESFERRIISPYTYDNFYYYFWPYKILFRIRKPAFKEIKHGEVFIFKRDENNIPQYMGYWDGTAPEYKYVHNMYIDAKHKHESDKLLRIKSDRMLRTR